MDIEHIIYTDYLFSNYKVIPGISDIIYKYLGFSGDYNQLIEHHINHQRRVSQLISEQLDRDFKIKEKLFEIYTFRNSINIYHLNL